MYERNWNTFNGFDTESKELTSYSPSHHICCIFIYTVHEIQESSHGVTIHESFVTDNNTGDFTIMTVVYESTEIGTDVFSHSKIEQVQI